MRRNSKIMLATGATALALIGLTACGPTAAEENPTDTTPGVEQPSTPVQPAPAPETTLPGDDESDAPGDEATDSPTTPDQPGDEETTKP
ncbi:MAG TPA: hypothetical protein VNQ48_08765 [Microbacteriaceae bacterium]|nr:hypothetical protein [Microbacteriaceae bacterium]